MNVSQSFLFQASSKVCINRRFSSTVIPNPEGRDNSTWFKLIDYVEKFRFVRRPFLSGQSRCLVMAGSAIPSLNLILAWLPLQNGMLLDAPHRQSLTRFRTSYGR